MNGAEANYSRLQQSAEIARNLLGAGETDAAIQAGQATLADAERWFSPGHPAVGFALYELALLQMNIQDYDSAAELLTRAYDLFSAREEQQDQALAPIVDNLARINLLRGRFTTALKLFEFASAIYQGLGSAETAVELRKNVAWLETAAKIEMSVDELEKQGRFSDAIPEAQQLAQLREQLLPPDHYYRAAALTDLGRLYREAGRLEQAKNQFERAREIAEKTLGPDDPELWAIAGNLGTTYAQLGRLAEAEAILDRTLVIDEAAFGPEDPQVAVDLNNLAQLYIRRGKYSKALPLLQRALAIEEAAPDPNLYEVAISLDNLAGLYSDLGEYRQLAEYRRRALEYFERTVGPTHPEFATCLNNRAVDALALTQLDEAEQLAQRALQIRQDTLGLQHPDTAHSHTLLGQIREARNDFPSAQKHFEQALAVISHLYGDAHPETADPLLYLGGIARKRAEYTKAEALMRKALRITETALGSGHPDTAQSQIALAGVCSDAGQYAEAEQLLALAVDSLRKSLGDRHPRYAFVKTRQANLLQTLGRLSDAERGHREAFDIYQETYGEDSPNSAAVLSNLARLDRERLRLDSARDRLDKAVSILEASYGPDAETVANAIAELGVVAQLQGQYNEAERLFRRALEIKRALLGEQHPDVVSRALALAGLYYMKGDYGAAEGIYQPAIDAYEQVLGPEHPSLAGVLNDYGNLLMDTGRLEQAEAANARALKIRQHLFGSHSRQVAQSTNNLAEVYRLQGRYEPAIKYYEQARRGFEQIYGPEHPEVVRVMSNIGLVRHALGNYRGSVESLSWVLAKNAALLGPDHPEHVKSLISLAVAYWALDEKEEALTALSRASEIRERSSAVLLTTGSERHRLSQARRVLGETDIIVAFHVDAMEHDSRALSLAFTTVLQRKGKVLDAMADTNKRLRGQLPAADQQIWDELSSVRATLAGAYTVEPEMQAGLPDRNRIQQLLAREERLQRDLSDRSAEYALETAPVTLDDVSTLIPERAALVEIVRFKSFDPRDPNMVRESGPARYVAYVLRRDGVLDWVDLGEAAVVDDLVSEFRCALQNPARDDVQSVARQLDERVMRPVRRVLDDTSFILLAPDSALGLIPFAALVHEDGRHLLQHYDFVYLDAGRDLLRLKVQEQSREPPVVIGNPNYGVGHRDKNRPYWSFLPDTLDEAEEVGKLLNDARVLTWNAASEDAVRELHGPQVLHIATHGYFDPEAPETEIFVSPLLRSGLAFAGANEKRAGHDGIMTALELSSVDLQGTELLVLSACETGLGDVQRNEGVHGLRRASVLAGARSQVISLWRVSSSATRALMRTFYQGLAAGVGTGQALAAAQRAMIADEDWHHPYYWATFVQSGAWGPLSDGSGSRRVSE